jgi:hypothetical protein
MYWEMFLMRSGGKIIAVYAIPIQARNLMRAILLASF